MGPANKVSEVVARNMGSKSPPADAPAPRLQNWREPYRALPNAVLRSALFAVIGKVNTTQAVAYRMHPISCHLTMETLL